MWCYSTKNSTSYIIWKESRRPKIQNRRKKSISKRKWVQAQPTQIEVQLQSWNSNFNLAIKQLSYNTIRKKRSNSNKEHMWNRNGKDCIYKTNENRVNAHRNPIWIFLPNPCSLSTPFLCVSKTLKDSNIWYQHPWWQRQFKYHK